MMRTLLDTLLIRPFAFARFIEPITRNNYCDVIKVLSFLFCFDAYFDLMNCHLNGNILTTCVSELVSGHLPRTFLPTFSVYGTSISSNNFNNNITSYDDCLNYLHDIGIKTKLAY